MGVAKSATKYSTGVSGYLLHLHSCDSQTFNRGKDDEFKLGRSSGACEWSGQ